MMRACNHRLFFHPLNIFGEPRNSLPGPIRTFSRPPEKLWSPIVNGEPAPDRSEWKIDERIELTPTDPVSLRIF